MSLFTKKIGPVFLKEDSDAQVFIEKMQALQATTSGEVRQKIDKQINLARYGETGENNIAFELRNSGMDMYILHDIYLETGDLSAQIDYIVITRKKVYVIECKNLIGNIEIDNTGAFIRSYELAGRHIKEGIYSPITQNQRHLQVLKEIRKNSKGNFFTKLIFEKSFQDTYQPIVVLANPKTYLNAKFAKKEVREQVIRADQLIDYIKKADEAVTDSNMSTDDMLRLAQFYLDNNQPQRSDYARKYEELATEAAKNVPPKKPMAEAENMETFRPAGETGKEEIIQRLKTFRLEQSRKEHCKPYYIFNDMQMEELIVRNPQNRKELLEVAGFGNVKVEKYGDAILEILHSEGRKI